MKLSTMALFPLIFELEYALANLLYYDTPHPCYWKVTIGDLDFFFWNIAEVSEGPFSFSMWNLMVIIEDLVTVQHGEGVELFVHDDLIRKDSFFILHAIYTLAGNVQITDEKNTSS